MGFFHCLEVNFLKTTIETLKFPCEFKKKLLEQFYANMEFKKEVDVKTEQGLLRFYKNNGL